VEKSGVGMKVYQITVGPFEMNCFIAADPETSQCILIDPGDEPQRIIELIVRQKLHPVAIYMTHNHIDHARRAAEIQQHFDLPFFTGEGDLLLLETLKDQGLLFGMEVSAIPEVSGYIRDGQKIQLGQSEMTCLSTPGHSPGGFSYAFPGHVFVGDVLFQDSIGRTDLMGGNYKQLLESIRTRLLVLPDETIVYSGHGPQTTIGRERRQNPFLKNLQV